MPVEAAVAKVKIEPSAIADDRLEVSIEIALDHRHTRDTTLPEIGSARATKGSDRHYSARNARAHRRTTARRVRSSPCSRDCSGKARESRPRRSQSPSARAIGTYCHRANMHPADCHRASPPRDSPRPRRNCSRSSPRRLRRARQSNCSRPTAAPHRHCSATRALARRRWAPGRQTRNYRAHRACSESTLRCTEDCSCGDLIGLAGISQRKSWERAKGSVCSVSCFVQCR